MKPIRIENWAYGSGGFLNPYQNPAGNLRLNGEVFGHPKHQDGNNITTTPITKIKDGLLITRSGSIYELGQPRADYEAAFPNAKQRLLNQEFTNV